MTPAGGWVCYCCLPDVIGEASFLPLCHGGGRQNPHQVEPAWALGGGDLIKPGDSRRVMHKSCPWLEYGEAQDISGQDCNRRWHLQPEAPIA